MLKAESNQKAELDDEIGAGGSRQRIIEAATALFVRDGYKATSVKMIAAEVGISPPGLYWHFKNKEALFLASMEYLLDSFLASVEASLTAVEPTPRLRQFVEAHVRWKLEQRESAGAYTSAIGMRDIIHSLARNQQTTLIEKQRRYLDSLRQILDAGIAAGEFEIADPRVTAFAIITLCEYVYSWYDPLGELSPDDVADRYGELVLGMVRTSVAPSPTVPAAAGTP